MNNWISVLDELPEIGKPVLGWRILYNNIVQPQIVTRQGYEEDDEMGDEENPLSSYWADQFGMGAFAEVYNEDGTVSNAKVSHWQPLPDGPK
jgi:hypothetical protein